MKILLVYILSYLLGTVSGSYLIGNIFLKVDIRKHGSGNAGTTNALRVLGKKWGVITFVIDFLKGSLIVFITKYLLNLPEHVIILSILFCVLGHDYPFHMNFKGGKGVATTMGSLAVFNFKLTFIAWAIWMIVVILSKMASLGSICFFTAIIILFTILENYSYDVLTVIWIISILGIIRHRSNIKRILSGNENKLGKERKK